MDLNYEICQPGPKTYQLEAEATLKLYWMHSMNKKYIYTVLCH